jgi:hypothetical protein
MEPKAQDTHVLKITLIKAQMSENRQIFH